jgi:hypothetical protein
LRLQLTSMPLPDASSRLSGLLLLLLVAGKASAAVLPEERVDLLYHKYDGGGVTVDGPSVLVRKNLGSSVSVGLNYYVDNVTSASIDVVTTASKYTEKRTEQSIFVDYLREKTTMSMGYTYSDENDFEAGTTSVGISQDMFGDLTTVSMGFSYGDYTITKNGDDSFEEDAKVRSYRVGLSQILTRNLVMSVAYEAVVDEGYLNNPYRSVRYLDPGTALGYAWQPEVYPDTHNSSAFALRGNYYFEQLGSAVNAGVRFYEDNWGIDAVTYELGYTFPYAENWIFEATFRLHEQNAADFYSDLFPYQNAQNYLARDKELSNFTSTAFGVGASYEFGRSWSLIDRGSLNIQYDWIHFDYHDFRDLEDGGPVGQEPEYSFNAYVTRIFASFWF